MVTRNDFTTAEKKDYINSVLCLQSKKSIIPSSIVPGARSRYDDFVATHINQTLTIHGTVSAIVLVKSVH